MKITPKNPSTNHNVSQESDGMVFLRYVWFFLALVVCVYVFFIILARSVVMFVSIEDEKSWFPDGTLWESFEVTELPEFLALRYKDIPYTIRIVDMEAENAFADLWGNIYLTRDLLKSIETYEALDFIMGHELWHIEERHVLRAIISDVPLSLILALLGWEYGNMLFNSLLSNNYSKLHETTADRYGLDYVQKLNGHVWCALDFFEKHNTLVDNVLEIFSTHPMTEFRISRIEKYRVEKSYSQEECTPFNFNI